MVSDEDVDVHVKSVLVALVIVAPLWCNCGHCGATVVPLWSLWYHCDTHCGATVVYLSSLLL